MASLEKSAMRKILWRLLPISVLMFFINIIDRANIAYTALDMNAELGIDPATFGLIASMFFVGYFFFEVPSNILLARFGARRWMARILVTWGLVTAAIFLAENAMHVMVLRFLLGICEAGFFQE